MGLKNDEVRKLLTYLEKEGISPLNALEIVKKHNTINPSNYRTHWKMTRFTLYLWQRIKEDKDSVFYKKGKKGFNGNDEAYLEWCRAAYDGAIETRRVLDNDTDLGKIIHQTKTPLYKDDTIFTFASRHYDSEINLLVQGWQYYLKHHYEAINA